MAMGWWKLARRDSVIYTFTLGGRVAEKPTEFSMAIEPHPLSRERRTRTSGCWFTTPLEGSTDPWNAWIISKKSLDHSPPPPFGGIISILRASSPTAWSEKLSESFAFVAEQLFAREKKREGGTNFICTQGRGGGAKQLRFAVENSARLERCSKRVSFFFFFLFERGTDEFYIYTRGRSKSWNLYKRDSIPPRRVVEEDEEIARKWEEVQVVYPCVYSSSRLINKRIFWIYESFKFHLPHSSFYKQIFNSRFRSSTRSHVDYY